MDSDRVNFSFSVPVERQELNMAVYNLKENIMQLSKLTEKIDATVKRDTTPCDIIDMLWLFQENCKMIDNVKEVLMNSDTNFIATKGEIFIDLYDTLVKENVQQEQTKKQIIKELKPLEDNLAKTQNFSQQIELNQEATVTSNINTPEMLDLDLLKTKTADKMRIIRANFHKLLKVCFKNKNTKDLIQDLTEAYFQGGDSKYVDVSEMEKSLFNDIITLKSSSLVIEHPYDRYRIKFDDFI